MSRSLAAAVLSLVAALGAAACSSPGPESEEFMAETVDVDPADPQGRVSRPSALTVGPDGTVVVTGWSQGLATVVTVDGGAAATSAVLTLPERGGEATAFVAGGEHLLGRWSGAAGGYVLSVLDPASGAVVAERPVTPWPANASAPPLVAVTPDALIVSAGTGLEAPVLLRVDPATGAVTASVTLPVDPGVAGVDWTEVTALAVGPDGSTVVAAVATSDVDGQRKRTSLVRLDGDLRPVGEPVPVTSEEAWTVVEELAVDGDGTVYAGSAEDGATVLVSAAPGATGTTVRARFDDGVTALAVRDGVAWLVPVEDGLRLHRVDLDSGDTTTSTALCEDSIGGGSGGPLAVVGDRVYLAGECGQDDRLWEFPVS